MQPFVPKNVPGDVNLVLILSLKQLQDSQGSPLSSQSYIASLSIMPARSAGGFWFDIPASGPQDR